MLQYPLLQQLSSNPPGLQERRTDLLSIYYAIGHTYLNPVQNLCQEFRNVLARDPQNNSARDWGPQLTLEVACDIVQSRANALLGLHGHRFNTKEQQLNNHNIILK